MALIAGAGIWSTADASPPASTSSTTLETHRVAEAMAPKSADPHTDDNGMGRWYAGLHIGAVIQPDMEIRGPGLKMDMLQDVGFIFDAVIGYKFKSGFRLESEFSYRNNDTTGVYFTVSDVEFDDGIGGADALTGIINGWYDFDFISGSARSVNNWVPYVGGGFGYTKVWINPGHSGGSTVIDSSDSTIVGQAGGGFIYNYTADLQISIDYRYLRSILDLEFRDASFPDTNDAVYQTHSIMLGFRGFF